MSDICVAYWSGTGNTEAMAQAIGAGITAAGKSADVVPMETISPADLKDQAVWVLGCPAMGAEELEDGTVEPWKDLHQEKRLPCLDPMTGETANGCVHGLKEWNRLAHRSSAEKDLSATEHREQMQ